MRVIQAEKTVFTFAELDDDAKKAAREWFRRDLDIDYESTLEDAKRIGEMFGINIGNIYFSGFWSQGDGAMFTGSYRYKAGWKAALKAYVGGDDLSKLERIGQELQDVQRANMYQLCASIAHRGHYYHSGTMDISVERDSANYQDMTDNAESDLTDALRSFADWIYRALEREYEFRMSDETVDSDIAANEYEFTADGQIV